MWQETTKQERNMKIFQEEFEDFLPNKILDFHVHVFQEGVIPEGQAFSCGGHPVSKYDLEDLSNDLDAVYPGRETLAVCFGLPEVRDDRALNDRYLAEQCDRKRFFPFRLFDPYQDDHQKVKSDIVDGRFLGLKPYLDYVRKENPNEVEVNEMLPPWIMEIADELGLIIMLHIPRKLRLADPLNQDQVAALCENYPNAKIVLAHVGRAYYLKNIVGHLDRLKDYPNIYFDLAMVNHWEVLEYLFNNVAPEKILYGTDIPIAVAHGKSIEINDQYTYVTPIPWKLSISDEHNKIVFTSFLYEELRGIRKAVERSGKDREFVEGVFYKNGMKLLGEGASS